MYSKNIRFYYCYIENILSQFLPPAGGGFTVGGTVAGAIMNKIL